MLTVIIVLTLFVGCFAWAFFDEKHMDCSMSIGTMSGIALVIILFSFINIGNRFNYIVEKYNNLKLQVEEYNNMSEHIKVSSLEYDIREDVLEMNNTISKHKVMSQSVWTSCWYSKKVGNLEKLKLSSK